MIPITDDLMSSDSLLLAAKDPLCCLDSRFVGAYCIFTSVNSVSMCGKIIF